MVACARRGAPINASRLCARPSRLVRAGLMVSARGARGECAQAPASMRAGPFPGKNAFLEAGSAQPIGKQRLVFPDATHNSCPTIHLDGTRVAAATYNRPPEPLLDVWTAFLGTFSTPPRRPHVFEHTSLAPSRKPISGYPQVLPTCPGRQPSSTRRRGGPYAGYSSPRAGAGQHGRRYGPASGRTSPPARVIRAAYVAMSVVSATNRTPPSVKAAHTPPG